MRESFRHDAEDILRRCAGVRRSATTTHSATAVAGAWRADRQPSGDRGGPAPARPGDVRLEGQQHTPAYLGLDAFRVPIHKSGGATAAGRLLDTAVLDTPDPSHSP